MTAAKTYQPRSHTYNHYILLFLAALMFCISAVPQAFGQEATATLKNLEGYRSYGVLSSFKKALEEDQSLYSILQQNPEFSEKVLTSSTLQRQILRDVQKTGEAVAIFQSYLTGNNGKDVIEAQRQQKQQERRRSARTNQRTSQQANQQASQRATQNNRQNNGQNGGSLSQIAQSQQLQNNQQQRARQALNQSAQITATQNQQAQQAISKAEELSALLQNHPEVLSQLLQEEVLINYILNRDLSLEQILAVVDDPEALAAIRAGNIGSNNNTATAPLPAGTFDINHAPAANEVTFDANGWPAYLNVPTGCAPPNGNVAYRVEHSGGNAPWQLPDRSRRGPDKGDDMLSNHNVVRSHFNRNGNWWVVNLTAREVLAAPFNADNQEVSGFLSGAYEFVTAAGFQVSIAYCPGDFREAYTPPNRPALSKRCAKLDKTDIRLDYEVRHGDKPRAADTICILEPGQRYFLNYRLHDADPALANSPALCSNTSTRGSQPFPQRTVNGETLPVCALQFAHVGNMHATSSYPPYAGPCLEQGPFPQNYNALTCGRTQQANRSADFPQGCNSVAAYRGVNKTCYDPTNNLPPQKFVHSCSPDGTRLTWLEGYNEPALNIYVCEDTDSNGITLGTTGYSAHEASHVACAAHRDGQTRRLSCPRVGPVTAYSKVEQCQFDEVRGRYDWATISETPGSHGSRCTYNAHQRAPAYKNTCTYQGQEYSLNTQATITCAPNRGVIAATHTATVVCEQRAQEPALPRFVTKEGSIPRDLTNHTCRVGTQRQ